MVHARRRPSIGTVVGVVAVCTAVLAGLAALALYLAPRVLPNLEARVASRDTVEHLSSGATSAAVTVPAGWVGQRGWGDDSELLVRSPDGALTVTFAVSRQAPGAAFADASGADRATTFAPAVTERLASGLDIVHADAVDAGSLVAAVGSASGPSVVVVVRAPEAALPEYRAVLAALVETVRVR